MSRRRPLLAEERSSAGLRKVSTGRGQPNAGPVRANPQRTRVNVATNPVQCEGILNTSVNITVDPVTDYLDTAYFPTILAVTGDLEVNTGGGFAISGSGFLYPTHPGVYSVECGVQMAGLEPGDVLFLTAVSGNLERAPGADMIRTFEDMVGTPDFTRGYSAFIPAFFYPRYGDLDASGTAPAVRVHKGSGSRTVKITAGSVRMTRVA